MSWISDRLKSGSSFKKKKAIRQSGGDALFEERAAQCWIRLTDGLQWDAKQLQRSHSGASFKQLSAYECRISSPSAKIAIGVNADLAARTISYSYRATTNEHRRPRARTAGAAGREKLRGVVFRRPAAKPRAGAPDDARTITVSGHTKWSSGKPRPERLERIVVEILDWGERHKGAESSAKWALLTALERIKRSLLPASRCLS